MAMASLLRQHFRKPWQEEKKEIRSARGNIPLSELSQPCNMLTKKNLLWLIQFKIPNALKFADIVRSMPQVMPQAARKTILSFYYHKLC